jgi:hypothetical protein
MTALAGGHEEDERVGSGHGSIISKAGRPSTSCA